MLEYEAVSHRKAPAESDKEVVRYDMDMAGFSPELTAERRQPGGEPPPIPPKEPLPELDDGFPPPLPPRRSPVLREPSETGSVASMALISTKDIMDMDQMDSGMANMHLHPNGSQQLQLPSSPTPKYLGWHGSSDAADPAKLGSSPQVGSGSYAPGRGLAPDRYGNEIPITAEWTKINRNLVSPEVLARAGVRYEARPTYVAVLGRLTRNDIAEFARQSAAARAARQNVPHAGADTERNHTVHQRTDSKSSRDDDDDASDDSDLFDESDTTDSDDDGTGARALPFIVSPPEKTTSPSATVMPKSILKNRNENHVHFDPEPYEVSTKSTPSGSYREEDSRRRDQPRHRRSRRDDGDSDRDEDRRRHRRHHHHREHRGGTYHHYRGASGDSSGGERHRPRRHDDRGEGYHRRPRGEREREKEKKTSKKKAWGETLGAVGLGGAAVSLLSVLAEAAT